MEENLVAQNPRDDLVLKINNYVDTQASAADNSQKIYVYSSAFTQLAETYFGLDHEFLKKLSDDELKRLGAFVYEKAKKRLWVLMPSVCLFSLLTAPMLGLGIWMFYCFVIDKRDHDFSTYKFVALHKWFWSKFKAENLRKKIS